MKKCDAAEIQLAVLVILTTSSVPDLVTQAPQRVGTVRQLQYRPCLRSSTSSFRGDNCSTDPACALPPHVSGVTITVPALQALYHLTLQGGQLQYRPSIRSTTSRFRGDNYSTGPACALPPHASGVAITVSALHALYHLTLLW